MKEELIKDNQEQAVASWVNYLNQVRLDRLMNRLSFESDNLKAAMKTLKETLNTIDKEIVNNGAGRGGRTGMHGFIAEVAECGIRNARSQIRGEVPTCIWINDNGPDDLIRGNIHIQQKFSNNGNHLSLQAIKMHFEKYPDYLRNGEIYQIPSDHYEKIKWYKSISKEIADKKDTTKGDFSLKLWNEVHEFFDKENISFDSIEPSILDYDSVQRDTYENTLIKEKKHLKEINKERVDKAYFDNKPSFEEGLKVTISSAVIEGATDCCIEISKKRKDGKKIKDFSTDDWKDVFGETGIGLIKGGVRGSSIYALTNYTATPAAVANSIVTASFGIAELAYRLKNGDIDEETFLENSEVLCLDASVSALSSMAGEVLIPIPVLGAVIGNSVGTIIYHISKDFVSSKIDKLLDTYMKELNEYDEQLQSEYAEFIKALNDNMAKYLDILDRAFSPDIRMAFVGSIELAKELGISDAEILDTKEKIDSYFLD